MQYEKVYVGLSKDQVRSAPDFNAGQLVDRHDYDTYSKQNGQ